MAIRNIITEENPFLHKKCRPVEKFDGRLWTLLDDMAETLREANVGPSSSTSATGSGSSSTR